jgi:hypothetical protein
MSRSPPTWDWPEAATRHTWPHAIRDRRAILTRNYGDFEDLHDLVVSAASGHHVGILAVLYDNNPRNNMSVGDIARAVRNLENAGVAIADSHHGLNHWQ